MRKNFIALAFQEWETVAARIPREIEQQMLLQDLSEQRNRQ